MIEVSNVRMALSMSKRWHRALMGIDLMAIATTVRLRMKDWTEEERAEVLAWIDGEVPESPEPLVLSTVLDPLRKEQS